MCWKPAIAIICMLAVAATATAAPAAGRRAALSAEVGPSLLDGTSHERVYTAIDHGPLEGRSHLLSELIWDLEGLYGVHASFAVEMDGFVELRASVFSSLNEGSGGMEDYDWFLYDRPDQWTHRSRSTVEVDSARDIDLRATLHVVRNSPLALDTILGWRYKNFKWEDRGIDYVYSSLGDPDGNPSSGYSSEQLDPEAVHDISDVDSRFGIIYEQTYYIPYVGLAFRFGRGKLQARAEALYSPIATIQDQDQHLLRRLVFRGNFVGGTYMAWKVVLLYNISRHFFLSASYDSQEVEEFRGDMDVHDSEGTPLGSLNNGASVEHTSRQMALTVGVHF